MSLRISRFRHESEGLEELEQVRLFGSLRSMHKYIHRSRYVAVTDWEVMILIKLWGEFEDFMQAELDTPAQVEWIEDKQEMKRRLFVFLTEAYGATQID